MPERVSIQAIRLVYRDDERRCDVLRTVGHRAVEGSTWHGPTRRTVAEARIDAEAHRKERPCS